MPTITNSLRNPCRILGILNVTPDSFSDGGRHEGRDAAVRHGLTLRRDGAHLVDVGGESTRPGAARVPAEEELVRVIPVVAELAAAGVEVSVDTTRRPVAQAAVAAGAVMVNDVSGGAADPDMAAFVAEAGVDYVVMHSRGPSVDMAERARYGDVVSEVLDELEVSVDRAIDAGIRPDRLIVDPGLGFAKRPEHDWRLLGALDRFQDLGLRVLIGASRKGFLGSIGAPPGEVLPAHQRDDATTAVTTVAAEAGVWGVRVHDVARSARAALTVAAIRETEPDRVPRTRSRASWRMTWAS